MTESTPPLRGALTPRAPLRPYSMFGRVLYAVEQDPSAPIPQPEPRKIELTEADIQAKIDAAIATERQTAADKAKAEKDEADRLAAEQKGEWEKIAKQAQKDAADAKATLAERDHHDAIRKAVSEAAKGKEGYAADLFDRYVSGPLITTMPTDAKPDAIAKAAKEAVEQFVTDNPRTAKGPPGVPPVNRGRQPASRLPNQRFSSAGVATDRF